MVQFFAHLSNRSIGRLCVMLFVTSTAFPITAGLLIARSVPRWLGLADVITAAVLLGVAFVLVSRSRRLVLDAHRVTAFRITQRFIGVLPFLLVLYFLVGQWIAWDVLTVGLAWRSWLFVFVLPYLVAARAT